MISKGNVFLYQIYLSAAQLFPEEDRLVSSTGGDARHMFTLFWAVIAEESNFNFKQ